MAHRFIAYNKSLMQVSASMVSVGCLINYSNEIIKVYKVGLNNILYRTVTERLVTPTLCVARDVSGFEPSTLSQIYPFDSNSMLNGSIVFGIGGEKGGLLVSELLPYSDVSIIRRTIMSTNEPSIVGAGNTSQFQSFYLMESYMNIYEHSDVDTQPLTLRQNEGLFILTDAINVATYINNYIEFTTE